MILKVYMSILAVLLLVVLFGTLYVFVFDDEVSDVSACGRLVEVHQRLFLFSIIMYNSFI